MHDSSSPLKLKRKTWEAKGGVLQRKLDLIFYRERVVLLSKIVGDPTVHGFRDKKESCSTQKGLHVDTGFREFPQTP